MVQINPQTGKLYVTLYNDDLGTSTVITSPNPSIVTEPRFFTLTHSYGTTRLYINAEEVASAGFIMTSPTGGINSIGESALGGGGTNLNAYSGTLEDLRGFNDIFYGDELRDLYLAGYPEVYPSTLPCPSIPGYSSNTDGDSLRGEIPFATEMRELKGSGRSEVTLSFTIEDRWEMQQFSYFFLKKCRLGSKTFYADWPLYGRQYGLEFRLSEMFERSALGEGRYTVSAKFEVVTSIRDIIDMPGTPASVCCN